MNYFRFLSFNVFGGIGWVLLMTLAGYKMGKFAIVRQHFEKFVLLVLLISVLPILIEFIKHRRMNRTASVAGDV
jgi:membrane-associated protein